MSQELSDAGYLRWLVEDVNDPPDLPEEGSTCIYLSNEMVARLRSIADRLERPVVEGEAGWMVKHDGRLILASFTETQDNAEWSRLRLTESYRKGEFSVAPVRIVEMTP